MSHEIKKTSHDILPSYAELCSVTEHKFHWVVINRRRRPGLVDKGEVSCGDRQTFEGGKGEKRERQRGGDGEERVLTDSK